MRTTGHRAWAASGLLCVAFFLGGLVSADLLCEGGVSHRYPRTTDSLDAIVRYVRLNSVNVRILSLMQALTGLTLVAFAVVLVGALRPGREEERPDLATLALGGAVVAATILLVSASVGWVLVSPARTSEPAVLLTLLALREVINGVAYLMAMSLFVGWSSTAGLRTGLLPRWLAYAGIAVALACLWAGAGYLTEAGPAQYTILFGQALWMPWIVATSIVLMKRARREQRSPAWR
jgi:hypothetical protein